MAPLIIEKRGKKVSLEAREGRKPSVPQLEDSGGQNFNEESIEKNGRRILPGCSGGQKTRPRR